MSTLSKPVGLILVLLAVCLFGQPAQAKYSGGTGVPDDPYQIATAEDLIALGNEPNDYDKYFILIDDMGIKQLPKRSGEYLFEIVMRRYETKSTIMTSNRPLEDWGKLLGDVPSATAILDRFLHHAEIITITGRSYRLKDKAGGSDSNNDKPKKEKDNDDNVQKKTKSD